VPLTKAVAEIAPGDHACAVVDSDEQHWEVAAGYVRAGLDRQEKVLYFDGERSARPLLRRLRESRVDVDHVLGTGQLVVLPPEAMVALWEGPADEVRGQVRETVEDALREGYRAVRLTDEPAAGGLRPMERLRELDHVVHEALRGRPVTLLCQYERRHWSGADLARLGELHPVEVVAPALYDDGLLRATRLGPSRTRLSGEIDYSNRELVRLMIAKELERSLRSPEPTFEVEVGLESLRFVDVTAVVQFVQAADGFPQTHRLVLRDPQPSVRRLLDRCGAAFCAQLDIRDGHRGEGPDTGRAGAR
jgi:anti-anti-sigma regulatory factor